MDRRPLRLGLTLNESRADMDALLADLLAIIDGKLEPLTPVVFRSAASKLHPLSYRTTKLKTPVSLLIGRLFSATGRGWGTSQTCSGLDDQNAPLWRQKSLNSSPQSSNYRQDWHRILIEVVQAARIIGRCSEHAIQHRQQWRADLNGRSWVNGLLVKSHWPLPHLVCCRAEQ